MWYQAWDRGRDGLAWLRADGELGFFPLTTVEQVRSNNFSGWTCTPEREGVVRCFDGPSPREDGTWRPLWSVRVELSDRPSAGEIERWDTAPHTDVVDYASDGALALLTHSERRYDKPEDIRDWNDKPIFKASVLVLWDVAARRPLRTRPVTVAGDLEILRSWCAEGLCTLVGVHTTNDAPDLSQLIAVTLPGGKVRTLVPHITDATAFVSGNSTIISSRTRRGIRLLAIGPKGQIQGHSTLSAEPPDTAGAHVGSLVVVGTRWPHKWSALSISPRAKVVGRTRIDSDAIGLQVARVGGGIVVAGLTGNVTYDDAGSYAFHNWSFEIEHRLIHPRNPTSWQQLLGSDELPASGEGRGGYDLRWLVRPDRAAIYVWSTGDAMASPRFIPVRKPCSR